MQIASEQVGNISPSKDASNTGDAYIESLFLVAFKRLLQACLGLALTIGTLVAFMPINDPTIQLLIIIPWSIALIVAIRKINNEGKITLLMRWIVPFFITIEYAISVVTNGIYPVTALTIIIGMMYLFLPKMQSRIMVVIILAISSIPHFTVEALDVTLWWRIIILGLVGMIFMEFAGRRIVDIISRLSGLTKELKVKQQQQEHLFAIIGHELRTPAATMNMLIHQEDYERTAPKGALLKDTSDHLLAVLDDMRSVIHPDEPIEGKIQRTNINSIIKQTIQIKGRLFTEANLNVSIDTSESGDTACDMNAQLIRQICMNLLKNCAFHSGATLLKIGITAKKTGQQMHISVQFIDNGRGIAKQHQKTLFDAFTRGDTHADGTGLGLHISREFARNYLDGELTYRDNPEGGAIFILTMVADIASKTEQDDIELINHLQDKRVLFVEDNPVIQKLSEVAIQKQGANVTMAENGMSALDRLDSGSFDVIITDVFMPEMNGYEMTEAIRASGNNIPIIGVTAATVGDETEKLLHAGANAVIEKPINMDKINQALETILNE